MIKPSVSDIVSLAMEAAKEDPIDFGMLKINEEESFKLIALGLLDNEEFFDEELGHVVLLSALTKSIVENFVLNLKLLEISNSITKH
jgi:hypothetical protein